MLCHMASAAVAPLSEHDVRRGVPVAAVASVAAALQLPAQTVLAWLSISPRTWARRKQAGALDTLESDRLARLTRLVRRAAAVLGGPDPARVWLTTAQPALGRRTPFEVAGTEVGADTVFQLLGRLEHGVFT
jgi:putative toxin-antitoxin system antitoxin component (TIGR02293 family)